MRRLALLIALASAAAAHAAVLPLTFVGTLCDAAAVCTPLTFTVQPGGVIAYTATLGGLTASTSGTWAKQGTRIRIDSGIGTFQGREVGTCVRGQGTFLSAPVRFEACR